MTDGQLNADVDQYLQAAAMNVPPPQIVSDPLVTGTTPVEQLLRVLGLAANLGDAKDNADSADEHAKREAKTTEAAEKFAAQDEEAAQVLDAFAALGDPAALQAAAPAADQTGAVAQQLPQAASSIAGAVAGALGGALQPLTQIPQQIAQGAQQAMQTGMGLLQQAAAPVEDAGLDAVAPLDALTSTPDDFAGIGDGGEGDFGAFSGDGAGVGDFSGGGGVIGGGLPRGTAPTSTLGPPPVPSASTAPSSSPVSQITPPSATGASVPINTGMAGMPMVPPGAMSGANTPEKDTKTDTRRVSVPQVRNGAPVQGRLTTPPALPPVTKKVEGAPVVTRRVVVPNSQGEDAGSER